MFSMNRRNYLAWTILVAVIGLGSAYALQPGLESVRLSVQKVKGYFPKEAPSGLAVSIDLDQHQQRLKNERDMLVDVKLHGSLTEQFEVADAVVYVDKGEVKDDEQFQPYRELNVPKEVTARFLFPRGSKHEHRVCTFYLRPTIKDVNIELAVDVLSSKKESFDARLLESKLKD